MQAGTRLGLLWIARFFTFLVGLTHPWLMMVYMLSVVAVPTYLYKLTRRFRDGEWEGIMSFKHGLIFCFLACFYASLLVGAIHYIYFCYFDNGYVDGVYASVAAQLSQMPSAVDAGLKASMDEALEVWNQMTVANITSQLMINNLFWGFLMSLPIALLVKRSVAPVEEMEEKEELDEEEGDEEEDSLGN